MTEIPEHLLKRAQEARQKAESSSGPADAGIASPRQARKVVILVMS